MSIAPGGPPALRLAQDSSAQTRAQSENTQATKYTDIPNSSNEAPGTKLEEITVTGYKFLSIDTSGTTGLPLPIEKVPQSITLVDHDFIQAADLKSLGYIALLDVGLLAVARRKEWSSLPILGAVGTVLMQIAWVGNFFLHGQYFAGNKTLIPMAVFLAFEFLFLAAAVTTKRAGKLDNAISGAALGVGAFAMC